MKKSIIALFTILATTTQAASIGQWNAYLAYNDITDIEPAGNIIYVLSSKDLFSYNVKDNSVQSYSKANILSDTEIGYIAWNPTVKKLIIIYSDFYNIDLLDNNGKCENISDYFSKSITSDKTVNNITINGIYAYISTGFGVMKINMRNAEISETYNLGKKITDCAIKSGSIYAKTENSVYEGKTTDNLVDPSNWKEVTDKDISFADDNDITTDDTSGYTEYIAFDKTNKCYWSNQQNGCLQCWTKNESSERTIIASDINAEGPKYNDFGFMKFTQGRLYTCGKQTIQSFTGDKWEIYQVDNIQDVTGTDFRKYKNFFYEVDVDPNDRTHVFVCAQNGLYGYKDTKLVEFYNDENSYIQSYNDKGDGKFSKSYELVTGLTYDSQGNLWCFNSQAPKRSILRLSNTKEWFSYDLPELMKLNEGSFKGKSLGSMENPIWDSRGLLWFVNNNWLNPSFYSFDVTTNKVTTYDNFTNQDGTSYMAYYVKCIGEDKNKNIWIGTDTGLFYLSDSDIRSGVTNQLNQYKVAHNDGTNLADYLLTSIDITCMAIDAANRKWYGTNGNGVYLISADNNTQEQHFLTNNSPLLSNDIESIAINEETGEVFFGTSKGLCSYISDATQTNEEMTKDNVWAYPNPVKPEYNGPITITGLSYNANVKICTSNGVLVNEGRSTGGSYTWNGRDLDGKKVASGVYMVQTATSSGESGTVCKVAIVR